MGENLWRDENEWPLARTRWTKFYLHSGGRANSLFGDGTLSAAAPVDEPADSYTYDPARPRPFITDPSFAQIGGPDDYRQSSGATTCSSTRARRSPRISRYAGPIRVRLSAASSAPDTDFMAKLIDV